ncbi:MAG: helix-turn-helix domain-containing protein [Dysgonomonas sp.]|nr:helix-turn-helix domain-containing protein [Dysgonomonas sp.]
MGIVDIHEHATCINYDDVSSNPDAKPNIEFLNIPKGRDRENTISESKIMLVMKGEFSISYDTHIDEKVSKGKMLLLPSSSKYIARIEEDASILIFRLREKVELCDRVNLEQLFNRYKDKCKEQEGKFNLLDIKKEVEGFINGLTSYISDGLKCRYFLELKLKEFFYLMRVYYSKEELAYFFYPLLSSDTNFSEFVYNNYNKVKTVQDLAALSNYSHSGFIKHFKKTFGVPAYQWMKRQKANKILHEINCSDKTIKQICDDYDFSSLSQFNDFCKSNFGMPPSQLRKSKNI